MRGNKDVLHKALKTCTSSPVLVPTAHLSPKALNMPDSIKGPENVSAFSFFFPLLFLSHSLLTRHWSGRLRSYASFRFSPAEWGSGVCQPICHCSFGDNTCAPRSTRFHQTKVEGLWTSRWHLLTHLYEMLKRLLEQPFNCVGAKFPRDCPS